MVNCVVYRDGIRRPGTDTVEEALRHARKHRGGFVWLGLHEPGEEEFSGVAELFGLHPLAVEDAVHAHQRPKIEQYGEVLFSVFKTVTYVEHTELTATSEVVDTGEIMVFTGPDFVVTVRHGRHGSLGPLREDLEAHPDLPAKGPSAVLHALADHVVDDYVTVADADAVQNDIDAVENDSVVGVPEVVDDDPFLGRDAGHGLRPDGQDHDMVVPYVVVLDVGPHGQGRGLLAPVQEDGRAGRPERRLLPRAEVGR